jgi:hypothetical protein
MGQTISGGGYIDDYGNVYRPNDPGKSAITETPKPATFSGVVNPDMTAEQQREFARKSQALQAQLAQTGMTATNITLNPDGSLSATISSPYFQNVPIKAAEVNGSMIVQSAQSYADFAKQFSNPADAQQLWTYVNSSNPGMIDVNGAKSVAAGNPAPAGITGAKGYTTGTPVNATDLEYAQSLLKGVTNQLQAQSILEAAGYNVAQSDSLATMVNNINNGTYTAAQLGLGGVPASGEEVDMGNSFDKNGTQASSTPQTFSDVLLGGSSGQGGGQANPQTEEAYSPFTAYLQSLGLGSKNYYNPAEKYQMNQYDPLSNIYDVRRQMSIVDPTVDPGNYVSPWASQNVGGATKLARNTLSQLFGMGQENQGLAGIDYSPIFNGTDSVDTNNIGQLQSLLKTGVRGNLGSYLASKLPWEQQQWGNNQAAGGGSSFLDYLKQKYNLGSLIG